MNMEEIMMGLYGTLGAPGAEDEMRRRRSGPGSASYEGIGGDLVTPGMMAPYFGGVPMWSSAGDE